MTECHRVVLLMMVWKALVVTCAAGGVGRVCRCAARVSVFRSSPPLQVRWWLFDLLHAPLQLLAVVKTIVFFLTRCCEQEPIAEAAAWRRVVKNCNTLCIAVMRTEKL